MPTAKLRRDAGERFSKFLDSFTGARASDAARAAATAESLYRATMARAGFVEKLALFNAGAVALSVTVVRVGFGSRGGPSPLGGPHLALVILYCAWAFGLLAMINAWRHNQAQADCNDWLTLGSLRTATRTQNHLWGRSFLEISGAFDGKLSDDDGEQMDLDLGHMLSTIGRAFMQGKFECEDPPSEEVGKNAVAANQKAALCARVAFRQTILSLIFFLVFAVLITWPSAL